MDKEEALNLAAKELGLATSHTRFDKQLLVDTINDMLQHKFEQLVSLLYRIDVDENKLRSLLDQNKGEDTAVLITDLIIERQLQKIKSREQYRRQGDAIDEEEKW